MADMDKAREGARQLLFLLQNADAMHLAELLKETLDASATVDSVVAAKKAQIAELQASVDTMKAEQSSQAKRTAHAKAAADDGVAACQAMVANAKTEHAAVLSGLQKEYDEKKADYAAKLAEAQAAYDASAAMADAKKQGLQEEYEQLKKFLNDDLADKEARRAELAAKIEALKAQAADILKG